MQSTIKDVAKIAGVSPSTVSRVISNSSKISEATKQKVYSAMKEMDYKPNIIARSLANKTTKTLGLVLPDTDDKHDINPFFIQLMRGISFYAQKRGYYILYAYCNAEQKKSQVVKDLVDSKWVDGIILSTLEESDESIAYLESINKSFVVVGRPENSENILWVDNDNFHIMYDIVNKLIREGRRNISFIGGPEAFTVNRDRFEGYKKALESRSIEVLDSNIKFVDYDECSGYTAMLEILQNNDIDALVTTDDILAFGAMKAIKEKCKEWIDVVGFNNTILAEYYTPRLSSVDIKADKLGYYAAKLLIENLENTNTNIKNFIVDAEFVKRDSTRFKEK